MEITKDSVKYIQSRYSRFYDGVVKSVQIDMGSAISVQLLIEATDLESPSGWSLVRITVSNVSTFTFQKDRTTFHILSEGVFLHWRENDLLIVLDASQDTVNTVAPIDLSREIGWLFCQTAHLTSSIIQLD